MPNYTIRSATAETILFAGNFPNLLKCVEAAISEGIKLQGADLRQANLLNAELDGGNFAGADFTGANLTGANLSEACLHQADFTNAILHGATLCHSNLNAARFDGTLFGATDITGAIMKGAVFSTLSAFSLPFGETQRFSDCVFINPCGTACPLSRQPFIVRGLSQLLVVMDQHIKVGHDVFALDAIPDWIASGGLNPRNLRLRLEQIVLALMMMDDNGGKIA